MPKEILCISRSLGGEGCFSYGHVCVCVSVILLFLLNFHWDTLPLCLGPFLNKMLMTMKRQTCRGCEDPHTHTHPAKSAPGAISSSGLGFNSRPPLLSSHLTCLYFVHFLHFNEVMNKCALQGKSDCQGWRLGRSVHSYSR